MTIDVFSKKRFETELPVNKVTGEPLWQYAGFLGGEHCYMIEIDEKVGIFVRSSVKADGYAAARGEDSIRAWLVRLESHTLIQNPMPLGSKVSRWVTRQPGWEGRLIKVLRTLWRWRLTAGDCEECGEPKGIYKVKKNGENKGRVFCKCGLGCEGSFKWLEEVENGGH